MLRKVLIMLSVICMFLVFLPGCKKSSGGKTDAEYKAEAAEQINKDNMQSELDNIEKQLEQEETAG